MARRGDGLGKKNSKLDTFLKKNLEADTFERIRCSDGCIICSENEDKAFKFVILTDEWIYLTENPPKKVYEEVHLRSIQSVELANDFPDFLVGEERENVQHIVIKHLAEFDSKRKKPKKSKELTLLSSRSDGSNGSFSSRSLSSRSITSTRSESAISKYYKDDSKHPEFSSQINTPATRSSRVQFAPAASISDFRHRSLDTGTLRELGLGDEDKKKKKKSKKTKEKFGESGKNGVNEELRGELKLDLNKLDEEAEQQLHDTEFSRSEDEGNMFPLEGSMKTAVLHIYILSGSSPFLSLVKGAWNNYIIRGTLEEDPDYVMKQIKYVPKTVPGLSARLELQFTQMRMDLLNQNNSMEEVFHLIIELKNASERQFFIKKMFWKTSELFHFFIYHLQKYLPTSTNVIDSFSVENQNLRADELEFVNLLVQTLHIMFRETEILMTRINTVKMSKGKDIKQLLELITSPPQIPGGAVEAPTGKTLLRTKQPSFEVEESIDTELERLCEEFTDNSTALLFEIFLMTQQGTFQEDGKFFTLNWIVETLEEFENTPVFVERMIGNLMNTVSPIKSHKCLSPSQVILLYYQVSVLYHIFSCSPEILQFVKDSFYEEFQYYVQVHIVQKRIPKYYLVRPYLLDLFSEIVSMVLGKEVLF